MAERAKRAHIRALHTSKCKGGKGETSFADAAPSKKKCDCNPRYRVQYRDDRGRWVREVTGRDRKDAEQRLAEISAKIAGDSSWRPIEPETMPFDQWADEWFDGLQRPKENTRRDYATTIKYAKAAFGGKSLRKIEHADIKRFLDSLKRTSVDEDGNPATIEATATTRRKHLRVLSAMFKAAADRRPPLIDGPVRVSPSSRRRPPTGQHGSRMQNSQGSLRRSPKDSSERCSFCPTRRAYGRGN